MCTANPAEIASLEAALAAQPESINLRLDLLERFGSDRRLRHGQRRIELVLWFVRNQPEHWASRSPFCAVDPVAAPEAYAAVRSAWQDVMAASPQRAAVLRGAAIFLCADDNQGAKRLMQEAAQLAPDDSEVWLDLGRLCREPVERLRALQRARELGSRSPNLLAWLGAAAVEAGDVAEAEAAGRELVEQAEAHRRKCGDAFDWQEKGAELWRRAREQAGSDDAARALVHAHSEGNYCLHAGHTTLGLVACRRGELERALQHLATSLSIRPDCRLSAYGPAVTLLREVCRAGAWKPALEMLREHAELWEGEVAARWRRWIAQVERGEVPEEA